MTIASELAFIQLPCNGVATQFSFNNKIFSAADLIVTLIDTLGNQYAFLPSGFNTFTNAPLGLSYTVNNVDVDSGCFIVFTASPTNGWTLDLRTSIAELQTTSIKNQGSFLPELHEEFFDKAVRLIQDLERLAYTFGIHGPDIENTPWTAVPIAALRANQIQAYNGVGQPTVIPPSSTGLVAGTILGTIAALRLTTPKTSGPQQVIVIGYAAQGDGGGGIYYYKASDTTSADDGASIIVSADASRWYLAVSWK